MDMIAGGVDTTVSFDDWTKERTTSYVGTNAGAEPLAFQNWRRFKEAFIPELIQRAATETSDALGYSVKTCLDPCAGSGTTPLACQFLGIHPIAIEVNPFLADLIEAKLCVLGDALVARRCSEVVASREMIDPHGYFAGTPATFVEPGVKGRFLFPTKIAERLATLVSAIERVPEFDIARLFRVLLASAALEVCNATISGKGRRYRKGWESRMRAPDDLDSAFVASVEKATFDIVRYAKRKTLSYDLRRGDARTLIRDIPYIDLAVFSPPYPNSFDYTDVYNIELWALKYLKSSTDNATLRKSTLRSHVQLNRDYGFNSNSHIVQETVQHLRSVEDLWNKNIPDMVGAYFNDLSDLLKGIRRKLPQKGRVYIVVGDSRYAGIDVPVAAALSEIAPKLGFSQVSTEPFRSMRASPQQGGRAELPETLLIFSAD